MPGRGEQIYGMYVMRLREGLTNAMTFLEEKIQDSVNIPYPPSSSPGNPPHRRTGHFQRHILAHEVETRGNELVGAVGINMDIVDYAYRLEFGDSKIAPRPYLRPGLLNNAEEIRRWIIGDF